MSLKRQMCSGAIFVGTGQVLGMAMSFIRNIIIARAVSLTDMGIAATIALTLAVIESASELGVNNLIIQSPDGDDPRLQHNAHLFFFLRGLLTASILAATAAPIARLFGIPQATWAFQMIALAPLIRGLVHQDLWRFHRHLRFRPLVLSELTAQATATMAAWPLSAWLQDYSAMLWGILIQVSVMTLLSHLLHERPYRLNVDPGYFRSIISFGWPLMLNGLLLILLNYGDRAIIAAFPTYSMADVGLFMVTAAVVQMPATIMGKLATTIVLPVLARSQSDPKRFQQQFQAMTTGVGLVSILQTIFLILAGPWLMVTCFGSKYQACGPLLVWIAAASGICIQRMLPTLGALALGDSTNPLSANLARCTGPIIAVVAATQGGDLAWFAVATFLGELISFFTANIFLTARRQVHDPASIGILAILLLSAGFTISRTETIPSASIWIAVSGLFVCGAGLCYFVARSHSQPTVRDHAQFSLVDLTASELLAGSPTHASND